MATFKVDFIQGQRAWFSPHLTRFMAALSVADRLNRYPSVQENVGLSFSKLERRAVLHLLEKDIRPMLFAAGIKDVFWRLIRTSKKIEFGLPFTLGNLIFLPDGAFRDLDELREILVHELVHIYQRECPGIWF